jgi:hypothetical protein
MTLSGGISDKAAIAQRHAAHKEFLTGTTEDRRNLQNQAKKREAKKTPN